MLYSIIRKPLRPRQYWNRVSDIFHAARMQIKARGADSGAPGSHSWSSEDAWPCFGQVRS